MLTDGAGCAKRGAGNEGFSQQGSLVPPPIFPPNAFPLPCYYTDIFPVWGSLSGHGSGGSSEEARKDKYKLGLDVPPDGGVNLESSWPGRGCAGLGPTHSSSAAAKT